jgi:hypothetical protein
MKHQERESLNSRTDPYLPAGAGVVRHVFSDFFTQPRLAWLSYSAKLS